MWGIWEMARRVGREQVLGKVITHPQKHWLKQSREDDIRLRKLENSV